MLLYLLIAVAFRDDINTPESYYDEVQFENKSDDLYPKFVNFMSNFVMISLLIQLFVILYDIFSYSYSVLMNICLSTFLTAFCCSLYGINSSGNDIRG